ncbi:MAG: hypothetical protein U9Q92_03125 [archaeon]|nr:hypothetical protein [archaeon]
MGCLYYDKGAENIFKQRLGSSEASRIEKANLILTYLERMIDSGGEVDRRRIEKCLYRYLTERGSEEKLSGLSKRYEQTDAGRYRAFLEDTKSSCKELGYGVDDEGYWFFIISNNTPAISERRSSIENECITITSKEYFSIVPVSETIEGVCEEIYRFISSIPVMAKKLNELSVKEGDQICLKTLSNITDFISHQDSLVIHYINRDLSQDIRETVEDVLKENYLYSGRKGRVESGFDFGSNMGESPRFDGSHSHLISRVVSLWVVSVLGSLDWSGEFKRFYPRGPIDLSNVLERLFEAQGRQDPESILMSLKDVSG